MEDKAGVLGMPKMEDKGGNSGKPKPEAYRITKNLYPLKRLGSGRLPSYATKYARYYFHLLLPQTYAASSIF